MNTEETALLRKQLANAMRGHEAHIDFESVVRDFPADACGLKLKGAPHTAWQLLEHMRIAQHDILEFSRNARHLSPAFPEGYWQESEAPPSESAWQASVRAFQKDAKELAELINHGDLFARIPHSEGQTLLREVLLVANHNSYHLGQLVFLKKMLPGKA